MPLSAFDSFEQAADFLWADELFEEKVVAGLVADSAGGDGGTDAQALGEGGDGGGVELDSEVRVFREEGAFAFGG